MSRRWRSAVAWIMLGWCLKSVTPKPEPIDKIALNHIANVSYASDHDRLSELASIFSPRMDFDQWKPLTGRGDPLRNDPTYDYEPPVLERVHYWADDTRLEREHYPERKSEVLMLGVSSRKPSVGARPLPPRRHPRPPIPPKYEDYTYKINDHYPMTILVPPPPPPPGHQMPLYILSENKKPLPNLHIKLTDSPTFVPKVTSTTTIPERLTSLYALQESNLIYQSSTISQDWVQNLNQTKSIPNAVSSDYAGWGPTTPLGENETNFDSQNLIITDQKHYYKEPFTFYKPILSEAPPPPQPASNAIFVPTFVPTALPPTEIPEKEKASITPETYVSTDSTTKDFPIGILDYFEETTTDTVPLFTSKNIASPISTTQKPDNNIFDMLGPMLTMPLVNGPDRPEDNFYAHASDNVQVFKEHSTEESIQLETMQTLQPPPPAKVTESTTSSDLYQINPHYEKNIVKHKTSSGFTHDPYLHMRFTTTTPTPVDIKEHMKPTTESSGIPYLIIQGHSKVKTYSSKPNLNNEHDNSINEISKHNETNEVRHLHPIKDNKPQKIKTVKNEGRSKSLKSLINNNYGSIEIQDADIGIKYDVSDGSDVPVEIYRKGIVEENDYNHVVSKKTRPKRQIDLEDLLPFDEDTIEEYVYNFLNGKRNSTGITGLIAQAVTSDAASVVDELEDDDDESDHEDER